MVPWQAAIIVEQDATAKKGVENFEKEDKRMTAFEIAEYFDMLYSSPQSVLSMFGMRPVCARWVPRLQSSEQMQIRVEISYKWKIRYNLYLLLLFWVLQPFETVFQSIPLRQAKKEG